MKPWRPLHASGTDLEPRAQTTRATTTTIPASIRSQSSSQDRAIQEQGSHPQLQQMQATNHQKRRLRQDNHHGVANGIKRISRLEDELEKVKKELAEEYRKRQMLETKVELIVEWIEAQDQ